VFNFPPLHNYPLYLLKGLETLVISKPAPAAKSLPLPAATGSPARDRRTREKAEIWGIELLNNVPKNPLFDR